MPDFCDVALPLPLDTAFTYRLQGGMQPVVGGRVLVPFRQQRMSGIVTALHDRAPNVQAKHVVSVLDLAPVLDEQLLQLGKWIADYYLAPLGEVFRSMLPLAAEFKRTVGYRMSNQGQMALHLAGTAGSSARSRKTPDEQLGEYRVLDYLSARETVREETLRAATRVSKSVLSGMVRKKWIVREDLSDARDAARTMKVAVLKAAQGKLNSNQQALLETLAAAGGGLRGNSANLGCSADYAGNVGKAWVGRGRRRASRVFSLEQQDSSVTARLSVQFRTTSRTEED